MRSAMAVVTAMLLARGVAVAQGQPIVEIGTNLGVAIQNAGGSTLTHFGAPGQGILGQPTIYASVYAGPSMLVEPQIALNIISSEGETATTVGLGGQVAYAFSGTSTNSGYLAGTAGFQTVSGGGFSDSDFGAGAKIGYRVLIGTSVGVRFEGGYRRWFDSELNEFSIGVGVGGIIHRTR